MRVKIRAHFMDSEGDFRHAELKTLPVQTVRDHIGELWVKKGWAIRLPEDKPEEPPPVVEPVVEEDREIEMAVIESAPETAEAPANRRGRRRGGR